MMTSDLMIRKDQRYACSKCGCEDIGYVADGRYVCSNCEYSFYVKKGYDETRDIERLRDRRDDIS